MKKTFNIKLLFSAILLLAITACEKEEEDFGKPSLPPQSAFLIDFSDFEADTEKDFTEGQTSTNFVFSALQVYAWNLVITVGLAVPVASYTYALEQAPSMVELNKWLWEYNVNVGQEVYEANLYGTVTKDSVFWEMYISKTAGANQFADYKWYVGAMNRTVTEGYWILNDNPTSNKKTLKIDWDRNVENQTWSIRYMNVIPDDAENGGFIQHGITNDPTFDAFFTIFNKGQDQTTNIEWNKTTIAGRVMAPHFYNDSNWHCWDGNQQDVDCTE